MLRTHLLTPPKIDPQKLKKLDPLISIVEEKLEDGLDVTAEMKAINEIANKKYQYGPEIIDRYWTAMSKEELMRQIAIPDPPEIPNITQEEIYEVIKLQTETNYGVYYLNLLKYNTEYPHISDLIYWPNELGYDLNLSREEMARIIFENEQPPKDLPPPIHL
jgi:hypothetical protein